MLAYEDMKLMRCKNGYYTQSKMADAITNAGREMTGDGNYAMSRSLYWHKEHGKIKFSTLEIKIIAKLFGLSIDDALDYFS